MNKMMRGVFILIALIAVTLLIVIVLSKFTGGLRRPEIVLTIVLILGVAALIAVLGGLLGLMGSFGLSERTEALGLPPGSIRAILALMLVLIFAITTIFVYYNSATGVTGSRGLTDAQVQLLPKDQIVAIRLRPDPTPPATPGPEPLFDVDMKPTPESTQLGQQLITLIGTLVTAVAAFYFGSNAVTTAYKSQAAARSETPPAPKGDGSEEQPAPEIKEGG